MNKSFEVYYEVSETYLVDEIWADGDAPENPTVDDVVAELERDIKARGVESALSDWGLAPDEADIVVTEFRAEGGSVRRRLGRERKG